MIAARIWSKNLAVKAVPSKPMQFVVEHAQKAGLQINFEAIKTPNTLMRIV